ncbi:hypothetical protein S40293_06361, partial [Stachybotrys chartarum IBT 40293]
MISSQVRSSRVRGSEDNPLPDSETERLSGLEELIEALEHSTLPGPAVTTGPLEYIAKGGQFVVYKGDLHEYAGPGDMRITSVAIKHPIFDVSPHAKLQLTMTSTQQHLKNIALEIKALSLPALRRHPNIVNLLSWSYLPHNVHAPLTLIMELAASDLQTALYGQDTSNALSAETTTNICSGIAAGLDAIHACHLIHGDIKPSNVLIFPNGAQLVPKLADFGLSFGGPLGGERLAKLKGTYGWRAPEVVQGRSLTFEGGIRADNFSFGLVASEVLSPSEIRNHEMDDADRRSWAIRCMEIDTFLQKKRNHGKGTALNLSHHPESEVSFSARELQGKPTDANKTITSLVRKSRRDRNASRGLILSVTAAFMKTGTKHQLGEPFELFLEMTSQEGQPDVCKRAYTPLDALVAAARQEIAPAQAALIDAFSFYGKAMPRDVEDGITQHLANAVATGSTLAKRHLGDRAPSVLDESLEKFRSAGGYASFYRTKLLKDPLLSLASSGSLEDLKQYLGSNPGVDLNKLSTDGETPLFLACARGSWDMAEEPMNRGAIATTPCTNIGVTCLHWAFAFQDSDQEKAISRLLDSGLDINAKSSKSLPCLHYPFQLPAGTPLHWAVVTHRHGSIQTLIDLGADANIKDGSDPYRHDHRVRILARFNTLDDDADSFSEVGTQGLSPLDYAAADYDSHIFKFLPASQHHHVHSVDEEGFTVLHRLSTSVVRRPVSQVPYSFMPFLGSRGEVQKRLKETLQAIKSLGGDLEQLTTPNYQLAQKIQVSATGTWPRYTPLMLAALSGQPQLVCALLEAGAEANTENDTGLTALFCVSEYSIEAAEVCRLLLSYGAKPSHQTSDGKTPLMMAAVCRNVAIMELLLSAGADVETIYHEPGSIFHNWGILEFLGSFSDSPGREQETYDESVASLLTKWLLLSSDEDKRSRIVSRSSQNSGTLLHVFSRYFMPKSANVIIHCGADVNALASRTYRNWHGGELVEEEIYETALDVIILERERLLRNMDKLRHSLLADHEDLCKKLEEIITMLQRVGGK